MQDGKTAHIALNVCTLHLIKVEKKLTLAEVHKRGGI